MIIRSASQHDLPAWERFAAQHPLAGPWHRFAWMRAVEEEYGFEAAPLLAEAKGRIIGILPLTLMRSPFFRPRYVSLPYCDAAGPLAASPETEEALLDAAARLAAGASGKTEIRSMYPFKGTPAHPAKARLLLDLPESGEALMRGFKAKLRSQVKKPLREGLSFALGGVELFDDFFSVWSENMRDIGSPAHSARFMRRVAAEYGSDARIGVVRMPDGEPAAAGMTLAHNAVVFIPWASSLRRHNRKSPNMLLYWGFLSHAADNGFSQFDFGRSTIGGNTYKFKTQWGAGPASLYWQGQSAERTPEARSSSSRLINRLVCAGWRKLPLPLASGIGPMVRKSISL